MKKRYRSSFNTEGVKEEGGALPLYSYVGDGIAFQFPVCIVVVVQILKVLGLFHMRAPFG